MIGPFGMAGWCVACFILGVIFDHFFGLNRKTFDTARDAVALCKRLNEENAALSNMNAALKIALQNSPLADHMVAVFQEVEVK